MYVDRAGVGPNVTLLHGFPGSAKEWSGVLPYLTQSYRVLTPDLIGFGRSPRPVGLRYSVAGQADALLNLWEQEEITRTSLVGYDLGAMVIMELLARARTGALPVHLDSIVLLNCALFGDTYRPRRVTRLMAGGPFAPIARKLLNEKALTASWGATFSPGHPLDPQLAQQIWTDLLSQGSSTHIGRLLTFVRERQSQAGRWDDALTDQPLQLIWGRQDLVSGSDIDLVGRRLPHATSVTLDDLGHAPHLEDPQRVGPLIAAALQTSP